jgi:threonyl-tRNA synthetase
LEYARKVDRALQEKGVRVTVDTRPEKIGYKVRDAQLEKIPYMLVVGEKEQTANTVSVRDRVDGDLGAKPVSEVLHLMLHEIAAKRIRQVSTASAGLADSGAKFGD